MEKSLRIKLGLCLASLLFSAQASSAPKANKAPIVLAEQDRIVAGGRALQLEIEQTEIATTVEIGRVMNDGNYGGGALGSWYLRSRDDKPQILATMEHRRLEAVAEPLRLVLKDFKAEELAIATTKAALAKVEWFQPLVFDINRRPSPDSREIFANVAQTPQIAFINYFYSVSHDFTYVEVQADIAIGRKAAKQSGIFYRHRISSIVQLPKRSFVDRENAKIWSADGGRLARASLTTAFMRLEQLIPHALGMSLADVTRLNAKTSEKAYGAGLYGSLIERSPDGSGGILIWSKGLISVQQASNP